MQAASAVIALKGVLFAYPGKKPILDNVFVEIEPEAMVVVTGPSGSGKSTLLRLLTGLEVPGAGRLEFMGRPYSDYSPSELRRRVMYVGQKPVAVQGTVRDNILLGFSFAAGRKLEPPSDADIKRMLGKVLLDADLDHRAGDLSVGQKQRLSILRAVAMRPDVLVLDEPTSALDSDSKKAVEDELSRLNREEGMTMVMVTHRRFAATGKSVSWHVEGGRIRKEES